MSRTSNQLGRAMSGTLSEFDRLDAIERAATKAALDRCRALADQVEKELLKVRAEDFHDRTHTCVAGHAVQVIGGRPTTR
jgi:hypothetical protein